MTLTVLIKWVMCKTSIPGKGLLKKQGLRKMFLRSERSKMFSCHFLQFTPNSNCPENRKRIQVGFFFHYLMIGLWGLSLLWVVLLYFLILEVCSMTRSRYNIARI